MLVQELNSEIEIVEFNKNKFENNLGDIGSGVRFIGGENFNQDLIKLEINKNSIFEDN